MTKLLLAFLYSLAALVSSCEKERKLPDGTQPTARYITNLTIPSKILGRSILYSVYLPDNYAGDSSKRYGVVYLLHGLGCDHQSWNDQYLNISSLVDSLEKAGDISEMIYIMPQGFNTYYVNKYDGTFNYMDMFARELVPFIDKTYRTIADRDHRAVAGFSMGGYGAMILPSKHPELFSISVPLSMSFRTDEQYVTEPTSGWDEQWGDIFGGKGTNGENRLTEYYKVHCPFYFFNEKTAASFSQVNFFIDCGDDEEQLIFANNNLHALMRNLDIKHEYRVRNGAHTSAYWRLAMREVLSYINTSYNGNSYAKESTVHLSDHISSTCEKEYIDIRGSMVHLNIFLPEGYDPNQVYWVVYFSHDTFNDFSVLDAMGVLDTTQRIRPFIFVAFDATDLMSKSIEFSDVITYIDTNYKTRKESAGRIGIGHGNGGSYLYQVTTSPISPIDYLFLTHATLNKNIEGSKAKYCYVDVSDDGDGYEGANMLYSYCRNKQIDHEYRVRNGIDSPNSILHGIESMIPNLIQRIDEKQDHTD